MSPKRDLTTVDYPTILSSVGTKGRHLGIQEKPRIEIFSSNGGKRIGVGGVPIWSDIPSALQ
jgi:hypothetical protein